MRRQMQTVAKIMNINAVQISQNKKMVEVKLAGLKRKNLFMLFTNSSNIR